MISKMKKLTFLVFYKEYEQFLHSVRDLGVVHITLKQSGTTQDDSLEERMNEKSRYAAALKLMDKLRATDKAAAPLLDKEEDAVHLLNEFDSMVARKAQLAQTVQSLEKEIAAMEPWGDFNPLMVEKLAAAGWRLSFFTCNEKAFMPAWVEQYNAIQVNKVGSTLYFVTLTRAGEPVEPEAENGRIAGKPLSVLQRELGEVKTAMVRLDEELHTFAVEKYAIVAQAQADLLSSIEFSQVLLSTERVAGEKLMLLEGWVPQPKLAAVLSFVEEAGVYYEVADPAPEDIDEVPIEFSNNRFSRLFEPICRLYMLPKYNEIDLTPFFAPFFMLFFGLCLGDIGYGLLFLTAATIYRIKAKKASMSMKGMAALIQILGGSTMVCGLLSGGFFGIHLYDINLPLFQQLKNSISLDNQQMFNLSLILGGIQIVFGMCLKAVNLSLQMGAKYSIATASWIVMILSFVVAALFPALYPMMGTTHLVIMGIAAVGIFLFNSPGKNIFLNIGLGLWDTYGMVTGLLGDVLSYVRLFALGLSGGILADVFNQLAVGMKPDNIIAGPIVMVIIFVLGHALNIFMGALGAFVHPLRLTFVEFFKNSGYTGGGKDYKPFKKEIVINNQ